MTIFGIPLAVLEGQLILGLLNGCFYALLSVGLALIFGMLRVVNFAHGALYMLGAFVGWLLLQYAGFGFWWALLLAPLAVALLATVFERTMLSRVYAEDHVSGLLLTLGIGLVIEGAVSYQFGNAVRPYAVPAALSGVFDLGFMVVPRYRVFVVAASLTLCIAVWLIIERTRLGASLRAANENPMLVRIFGINVPRMMTLTYAAGAGLAAVAGVVSAPIYQVSPLMGQDLLVVVFAIVVIGGIGSIFGSIVASLALGIAEGLTRIVYPEGSAIVVFIVMTLVLLVRSQPHIQEGGKIGLGSALPFPRIPAPLLAGAVVLLLGVLPTFVPAMTLMKLLCYSLFAAAFNLLFGVAGLLSFGNAAFFGGGAYAAAIAINEWGTPPEVALLLAVLVAAGLGAVFGFLAVRRKGIYFAMVTLALAQMFYFVCLKFPFTGGEDGVQGVARGHLFAVIDLSNDVMLYAVVAVLWIAAQASIWRIVHSPFGNILGAIRDDESRVASLGIEPVHYKWMTFVLCASLSGLAGGMKAIAFQFATLADVGWQASGDAVVMTILGGVGTFLGPLVGSAVYVTLQSIVTRFDIPASIATGLVFVLCVLALRGGLYGFLVAVIRRVTPKPDSAMRNQENIRSAR
jgi:branched-chain amino acid transport system permease protein